MSIVAATCATLAAVLASAQPGDTVRLAGKCGDVSLPQRNNAPAITIDASRATVRSLMVRDTAGWVWKGGTIDSPLPPVVWRNVMIDDARRIEVAGVTLTGGHTGVVVTRGSEDVVLRGNLFTDLQSDGINVATARRVSIIGNSCKDFHPIAPVYENGRMVKDGTHPDCIMLWSEKGQSPTSDITITGNTIRGAMQGISHFWHPRLGRDKVYRVTVWDNDVEVSYWHGIFLENTPGSDVRRNCVRTTPGATALGNPAMKVTAWLRVDSDAKFCGNSVGGKAVGKPC